MPALNVKNSTEILSYSTHAVIGAADRALQEVRSLVNRREQLPEELSGQLEEAVTNLRETLDEVAKDLRGRARTSADEAGETLDELAARGQAILERLRQEIDLDKAGKDVDNAAQGWKAALTTLRRNAEGVVTQVKSAITKTERAADTLADTAEGAAKNVAKDLKNKVVKPRDEVKLSDQTKGELYELATQRDIEGRSTMSKQELIAALSK